MRWGLLIGFLAGCASVFDLDHVPTPPAPDAPTPIVGRWSRVVAGRDRTCALDVDAHLWCWGRSARLHRAQLGNGTFSNSAAPNAVRVGIMPTAYNHTCVLDADKVWCWGQNDSGQVGNGGTATVTSPYLITTNLFTAVGAGCGLGHGSCRQLAHVCAQVRQLAVVLGR